MLFVLKTEKFEGPLPLLLALIEKRKLHISEVSLALIADEYIAHLEEVGKSEKNIAEFLGVMSTLLLIKARSLLPGIELSESEQEEIVELEENLRRYQVLARSAANVQKRVRLHGRASLSSIHDREEEVKEFRPFRNFSLDAISTAVQMLLMRIPELAETYRNIKLTERLKLEHVIADVLARINSSFSSTFSALHGSSRDRSQVVVTFLALLELVKGGIIRVAQKEAYGEINIEKSGVDLPRYGT